MAVNFPDWSMLSFLPNRSARNGSKQRQNEALELKYLLIFEKSYRAKKVELKARSWFPIPVKNAIKIGREKLPQETNANG